MGVILGTMPGERPMRPEFGCAVHDHVFAGIDGHTLGRIEHEVRVALDRWEPRARVLDVDFDLSEREQGRLLIDITYRIRATNDVRNLVYPFYLIPSEEESHMSLPQLELDDRRFQDLVNEARTRVARACPEWTEHNVSDPGITLIELFAWMTDMLVYRMNRIPDKLHVALLELLGVRLRPPVPAATDLRLRLAAAAAEPLPIPAWDTEAGTLRTAPRAVHRVPDRRPTSPSRRSAPSTT